MSFRRCILLFLIYLIPSISFATKRMAVLEFRGVGVDAAALPVITDYVRSGVLEGIGKQQIDGQDMLVMTRENMMDMLSSMGKSAADCQGECVVEIARNIGTDYVVSGETCWVLFGAECFKALWAAVISKLRVRSESLN